LFHIKLDHSSYQPISGATEPSFFESSAVEPPIGNATKILPPHPPTNWKDFLIDVSSLINIAVFSEMEKGDPVFVNKPVRTHKKYLHLV